MESAIDQHLTCPRTLSRRVPGDYQPPFPMFVGRADPSVQQVVMAYLGVQCGPEDQRQDWKDTEAAERALYLDGNLLDESYNIGHWHSLERLERWAESHPTHLRIFTTFFRVAAGLEKLRLYHEASVSDAKNQVFEYINCHPQTGMMRDAVAAEHLQPASG